MSQQLEVLLHDRPAGRLERGNGGRISFSYHADWVEGGRAAISLSLPPREPAYDDAECRGYFSGLLPEGGFLRSIARAFGVSATNPFSVLEQIGGECAGAVTLLSPGAGLPLPREPKWLSTAELLDLLEQPQAILAGSGTGDGLRLSLAGAQEKLPVRFERGKVGLTRGEPPSTHVLKLPIQGFADTVANEAYCLRLARESGLPAAEAVPRDAASSSEGTPAAPYLAVRRYDRDPEAGTRIHQEDFCQALGVAPEQKYQAEGGPGVRECAELIGRSCAVPARDRLIFADALLFNFVIGNHDAHSKNFSLLLESGEGPRLTPLYDLVSTSIYPGLSRKMAMSLGGEYRPGYFRGRHLDRLAGDLSMRPAAFRRRAGDLTDRVERANHVLSDGAAPAELGFSDDRVFEGFQSQIAASVGLLRTAIEESERG